MKESTCYYHNRITECGFYSPFVAVINGTYYVGDCDNLDGFSTVEAAIAHCNGRILTGDALANAKRHHDDCPDNYADEYCWRCDALLKIDARRALADEYCWHCDALLQIDALRALQEQSE